MIRQRRNGHAWRFSLYRLRKSLKISSMGAHFIHRHSHQIGGGEPPGAYSTCLREFVEMWYGAVNTANLSYRAQTCNFASNLALVRFR